MSNQDKESWERIGQHVLLTLERMEETLDDLESKLNQANLDMHVEITALKVKAGLWGTIAGIVASAFVSILVGYIVYNVTKGPEHTHPPVQKSAQVSFIDEHNLLSPRDNERLFSVQGRTFIL